MKVVTIPNLTNNFNYEKKPLIAIWGFFDGWHLGHQKLLNQMQELANKHNYQTLVISFDVKPQSILLKKTMPILMTNQDKEDFLAKNNQTDYFCQLIFKNTVTNSAQDFINWLIANNVQAVVVSNNISFGDKGQGNLETLKKSPLKVFISEEICDTNHKKISSSYIKELILNKNITSANKLLNSEYTITGTVVDGIKEGRTLGFPTANLKLTNNYVVPGLAVYITQTKVNNKWYQSMTIVIIRYNQPLVETYLLKFNENIYGKTIKIKFLSYLRDNIVFSNKNTLIEQIKKDLENTILYFKNT